MDRQQQGPPGEDDFLEQIRRAAARTPPEPAPSMRDRPRGEQAQPEDTTPDRPVLVVSTQTTEALRALESRIAGLEQEVRRLNEDRARVVSDVADAVVARLDARWARSLGEGGGST